MASNKITADELVYREVDESTAKKCQEMINYEFLLDEGRSKFIDPKIFIKYNDDKFGQVRKNEIMRVIFLKSTNQMIGAFHLRPKSIKIDDVMRKVVQFESLTIKKEFQKKGLTIMAKYEIERVAKQEMGAYAIDMNILEFNAWEISLTLSHGGTIVEQTEATQEEFPEYNGIKMGLTKMRKVLNKET